MNKNKVSKCCGAELYDQSETGYAPNEVCSNCEKRAESIEEDYVKCHLHPAGCYPPDDIKNNERNIHEE
jgi:hypothetical protein|tara:strand:- start:149 stop:355 length:207 start_codon:yes stop_codon:yes gene_type:complete